MRIRRQPSSFSCTRAYARSPPQYVSWTSLLDLADLTACPLDLCA